MPTSCASRSTELLGTDSLRDVRKLLVFLVILGVLAVGVDYVARGFAQEKAEEELKARLGLSSPPSVSLEGWPFLLSAARGEFRSVELEADRM